jgi:hypothetical protein
MLRWKHAILTVILSIGIFGALGALIGTGLGSAAPTFGEWMMGPSSARFDMPRPYEFALGIGLLSGLAFGGFLGITLVVLLTLRDAWVAAWTRCRPDEAYDRLAAKPATKPSGLE